MKKEKPETKNSADTAWELFEKTGRVSYYILYKKLTDK